MDFQSTALPTELFLQNDSDGIWTHALRRDRPALYPSKLRNQKEKSHWSGSEIISIKQSPYKSFYESFSIL